MNITKFDQLCQEVAPVVTQHSNIKTFGKDVSETMAYWYDVKISPELAIKLLKNGYFVEYNELGLDTMLREKIVDELAFIATGKGWPAVGARWPEGRMSRFINKINSVFSGPTMSQYSKLGVR